MPSAMALVAAERRSTRTRRLTVKDPRNWTTLLVMAFLLVSTACAGSRRDVDLRPDSRRGTIVIPGVGVIGTDAEAVEKRREKERKEAEKAQKKERKEAEKRWKKQRKEAEKAQKKAEKDRRKHVGKHPRS